MQIVLRIISVLLTMTGAGLLLIGLIEPYILKIERIHWRNKSASADTSNVAGLRLVLLSDLHTEFNFINRSRLTEQIKLAKPDLIVFAGDWVGQKRSGPLKRAGRWQEDLSKTAKELGIEILAVAGNHDDELIRNKLMQPDSGIKLLVNEAIQIEAADGSKWQLIGFDDLRHSQPAIPDLLDLPSDRTIIVAHNPDTLLQISNCPGNFFLSGHFHGGQIWAPGKLEFKLFRKEHIASMGFYRGEFLYRGKTCYISRGLGCVVMPIRLFSLPEMTIIEITS